MVNGTVGHIQRPPPVMTVWCENTVISQLVAQSTDG